MKFNTVDLVSSDSTTIFTMSFQDPTLNNPYILKALLGLDVEEITTRYYGKSGSGNPFYTMNVGPRTVVIQVSLNPNYAINETVATLRAEIYKAISSSRTGALSLRFMDGDMSVALLKGFVKKVEVEHFSSKPDLKITLDCSRDPLLRSEIEYFIPVLFDNPNQAVIEDFVSEAPHGFKMELSCSGPVASFALSDTVPHPWSFTITPGTINGVSGFVPGDILHISSEDNNRYVYIVRSGIEVHLANKVLPGSIWPIMFPGLTTFGKTDDFDWETISYRQAFWGI